MRKIAAIALLAFALLFFGCVSPEPQQDNKVSGTGTPQAGAVQNVLSVVVYFKGPVEGASVRVYSLNADGSKNELLAGPIQTDDVGEAYFEIPQPTERFLVESTGGAYFEDVGKPASEAYAGKPVVQKVSLPAGYAMRAFIPAENNVAVVTPFTEMAVRLAQHSIRKGVTIDAAARAANIAVSQQYRQENVIWRMPVAAYDPSAIEISAKEAREYGLLLAGLVVEAVEMNVEPSLLAVALAEDWSDGKLDGMQDGEPISVNTKSGGSITLSASAGLVALQKGINEFLASPVDATQIKQFLISSARVSTDPLFYIDVTLPAWIDGQPGSYDLTAVGGKPDYSWQMKKGSSLPQGFSLSSNGTISGTGRLQSSVGSISPPFTVVVSDSSKPPQLREMELRIEIIPKPPQLEVEDVECEVGVECNVNFASNVAGGTPPYHFVGYASDQGQYPLDLMVGLDGTLEGIPSIAGDFALQVCVVDLIGWSDCKDVNIQVSEGTTTCSGETPQYMNCGGNEMCCHQGYDKCCKDDGTIVPSDSSEATVCCKAIQPTVQNGNGGGISCSPGHYAVNCGGWRCCLNGWVCVGGGRCAPG